MPRTATFINRALKYCLTESNSHNHKKEVIKSLRHKNPWTHGLFRYALAKEIVKYLVKHNRNIDTAYLHGSVAYGQAGLFSDIDLILCVQNSNNKKLQQKIEFLDTKLTKFYKKLVNHHYKIVGKLLDIHLVSPEEVKQHQGFASLITSIYTPPSLLWTRHKK